MSRKNGRWKTKQDESMERERKGEMEEGEAWNMEREERNLGKGSRKRGQAGKRGMGA